MLEAYYEVYGGYVQQQRRGPEKQREHLQDP